MEDSNRKWIRIKEKQLATLDKRTIDRRSALERELATLDEHAERERETLERELHILRKAAHITEQPPTANAPTKGYTRQAREELFDVRSQVMRRLLEDAHGRDVYTQDLAVALNLSESTVRDYYNDQLEQRPADCFWQNGIDKVHFRWKDGHGPSNVQPARVPYAAQAASPDRWHTPVS